jgi:hypothetical protein
MAHDLAVQPPHPWLVEAPFSNRAVKYDSARADRHAEQMIDCFQKNDISASWYSCLECIHHSCSAILAFYGSFIGANYLAPLHCLINVLQLCLDDESKIIWDFSEIKKIETDLHAINKPLPDFVRLLKKTSKNIPNKTTKSLKGLIDDAKEIHFIMCSLLEFRSTIRRFKDHIHVAGSAWSHEKFLEFVRYCILGIPNSKLSIIEFPEACFEIHHNIDTAVFRQIKPKIYFIPIYGGTLLELAILQKNYDRAAKILKREPMFSNSAILACNGNIPVECRDWMRQQENNSFKVSLVRAVDLMSIFEAKNVVEALEELIISH